VVLTTSDLRVEYERALAEYLDGASEAALLKASSLGKRALTGNLGVLDVVVLHHESLARIPDASEPGEADERLRAASTFLCEALSSFEITHRAFEEVTEMLNRFIQFAHVVCHELRTPLTSLLCSVGVLKEVLHVPPDSIEKRLLGNIMLSTDTLKKRTDDLVDLVGLQSGGLTVKQTTVKPGRVLGNVLARMNEQISLAGLKLETAIADPLPDIRTDSARYEQILTNLLQNAVKYGSDGGVIEVRAYGRDRSVFIEIEDHGHGMSAWDRLNMYHPSYRSPRYSHDVPDLGIGLALCKELVTHLNGAITFDTKEGEGSIFRVELPQA